MEQKRRYELIKTGPIQLSVKGWVAAAATWCQTTSDWPMLQAGNSTNYYSLPVGTT